MPQDKVTLERIQLLHPLVRVEALSIYNEIVGDLSVTCRFTSTLRTFKEQQAIYNLGRTVKNPDGYHITKKPMGNIVSNAKPGTSLHNYGLALDIAFIKDGKLSYDMKADWDGDKNSDWYEVVGIFEQYGWEWGGRWATFKDYPHFQKTFGYSVRQLLTLHQSGQVDNDGYVKLNPVLCPSLQ